MIKKISYLLLAVALVAGAVVGSRVTAATATVTSLATANITSDSVTGAPVALPVITVTESSASDINAGTLIWVLPGGFVLDTSTPASVSLTGTGLAGSANVSYPDSTHFSLTITATSSTAGTLTIGSSTPLKIKAAAGTPLALGNITLSSGNINGISASTNFGTLTQVPGAVNKLLFTQQPPTTVIMNSVFSAKVGVFDQFGNMVSADNGRNISLSPVLSTSTTGSLNGTLTQPDTNGIASFADLSFTQPGSLRLAAQSNGLTGVNSTTITVTSTTTSLPLFLPNGTFVQLEGNPTIYIVQNGKLIPVSEKPDNGEGEENEDEHVISEDHNYNDNTASGISSDNGDSTDSSNIRHGSDSYSHERQDRED